MNQSDPSTETSAYNVSAVVWRQFLLIPTHVFFQCVTKANIDFNVISQCYENEGGEVLARLGNKTKAAIDLYQTGVPTIIFEDRYSSSLHTLSTSNFTLALCTADAEICASKVTFLYKPHKNYLQTSNRFVSEWYSKDSF